MKERNNAVKYLLAIRPNGTLEVTRAESKTYEQMRGILDGGFLEHVYCPELEHNGIYVIVDEEGVLKDLAPTMALDGNILCGPVIFCGLRKDGDFGGLPKAKVDYLLEIFDMWQHGARNKLAEA